MKGKEGEFAALEVLTEDVKDRLMPLIEVPNIPYDYVNDRPAKSLEEHVSGVANRLRRCWPNGLVYIFLPWFGDDEQLAPGRVAYEAVLTDCQRHGVQAVPVVSLTTSAGSLAAIARYSEASASTA